MQRPDWAPDGIDIERPSAARIYDYLLGGSHNFAADREIARQAVAAMPDVAVQARANRAFLHRAVRFLVGAGVHQFLDIGSGVPTVGNVHEIAQTEAPDATVVYVDIDPVAVAHSRHLLSTNDRTAVLQEDLRHAEKLLEQPEVHAVLDLSKPVAVLLVAVLHAIPDEDDPVGAVRRLTDELAAGSYLAIAHGTAEGRPEESERLVEISKRTTTPLTIRDRPSILRFFDGFDLVEPGLVFAPQWHPESPNDVGEQPWLSGNLVGVGRKR